MVYEPQEDSFLLEACVKKYAQGVVLDLGTGSGIQALAAAQSEQVTKVFAVDVNKKNIAYAKKRAGHKKISWRSSDLFGAFSAKKYENFFDTIIFNPPYLPQEFATRDSELEGGKRGNEVIAKFISRAKKFLKPNGLMLLVCSSFTPEVEKLFDECLLVAEQVAKEHVFFEDIFVYLVRINPIFNELQKSGIADIEFFAKGKRGLVFTGKYQKKKVAIKIKRKQSTAQGTVLHEANMLQEVNKHKIGPIYLFNSADFLVYEFVQGTYLKELIGTQKIKKVCREVLRQCYVLDKFGINKQEMTRPYKHVIVKNRKVTFIDFERARKVEHAHNVTAFCQFLRSHVVKKKAKWISLAKKYNNLRSVEVIKLMEAMLR